MELSGSQEADEITMPISMNYIPFHESSKLKMLTDSVSGGGADVCGANGGPPTEDTRPSNPAVKKDVRYRECRKNHAASMGGHALDGCGEFMPSGDEGSLEALKCAACSCHRNFHRREVEGEPPCYCSSPGNDPNRLTQMALPPHPAVAFHSNPVVTRPPPQMIMALSSGRIESEDQGMGPLSFPHPCQPHSGLPIPVMKKRFRTKFSSDQKEKMSDFAEKLGWRIQKHDEAAVQQFCSEVGVKRRVLKVWMHNN
eukprot:c22848_g1_i2 orf=883-1647(+)